MIATTTLMAVTGHHERSWRLRRGWVDRLVGSDPGLNRLFKALEVTLALGAGFGAEWLFVQGTSALMLATHGAGLSVAEIALARAHNHGLLVTAMAIGSLTSFLTAEAMNEPKVRDQLITVPSVPVPMVVGIALGLSVNSHRVLSLVLLTATPGVGIYLRRFGPRGAWAGITLFMGFLLGYFFRGVITLSGLGWLAAEIGLGTLMGVIIHLLVFFPRRHRALRLTQRSYVARARKTARLALAVFDDREGADGPRSRQLRRQLVRLNEAALIIDAQLVLPGVMDEGSSPQRLHERLFDIELALTNVARFAKAMGPMELPAEQRALVRQALINVYEENLPDARASGQDLLALLRAPRASDDRSQEGDRLETVIPHRFAGSVIALRDALTDWLAVGSQDSVGEDETAFQPAAHLANGWLLGSALVSAEASAKTGPHFWDKVRLQPYTRAAIQTTVGIAAAIAAGDALSGTRFYWAVAAVYASMMSTNNAAEQTRKALFRVAGTVVGVGVGLALAHAVGHHTNWTIVVILAATLFGSYLTRISYAYFVIGLVVALSELYVQLGDFSNSLLLTRLEETALGAAIALLTFTIILPVRARHVGQIALRHHLQSMATLVRHATERVLGGPATIRLRSDARALDNAHQTLIATLEPLRRSPFGELDERVGEILGLASAYRHYGRALVTDIEAVRVPADSNRLDLERACQHLNASIDNLLHSLDGKRHATYVRSAALFDRVERELEGHAGGVHDGQLAVRDLTRIDEAMAGLAAAMNIEVTNYDTAGIS